MINIGKNCLNCTNFPSPTLPQLNWIAYISTQGVYLAGLDQFHTKKFFVFFARLLAGSEAAAAAAFLLYRAGHPREGVRGRAELAGPTGAARARPQRDAGAARRYVAARVPHLVEL